MRVGFLVPFGKKDWAGGVNYIKNLLYAIHRAHDPSFVPVVFLSKNADREIYDLFSTYAEVVTTPLLDKWTWQWILWRATSRIFKSDWIAEWILRRSRVSVFSHSNVVGMSSASSVCWIPDFQHVHLPHLFSKKEIAARDRSFRRMAERSELLILSSYDALRDFRVFSPEFASKGRVLHFVAQPKRGLLEKDLSQEQGVLKKYGIFTEFFFLPNQFWQHKNHRIVFEALVELKRRGKNVLLVCSGYLGDHKKPIYVSELLKYIEQEEINVKMLGLIEYDDVVVLMKASIAVINPSLFEGWSSSVEECKTIRKRMVLSDIPVHREQQPDDAIYFNPSDPSSLASCLLRFLQEPESTTSGDELVLALDKRTDEFFLNYRKIIVESVEKRSFFSTD